MQMKNVLEFLEKTTERYPHKVAVDDGRVLLTWQELQDLSQRMGTGFCKLTGRGRPVVLLMEKSALTLAAMMGVVYSGCFYVMGEHKRTDWFVRHVYEKAGFFTPPYETVSSLKARLDGMYTDVDMGNLKSMAWFVCRKAG